MISMSAQERQRQLNLVDMHAMPHEALVGLIEKATVESQNFKNNAANYAKNSTKALQLMKNSNLIKSLDLNSIELESSTLPYTVGIDGSNQPRPTPDGYMLYFFSAVRINFEPGNIDPKIYYAGHTRRIRSTVEESAGKQAELFMTGMETKELRQVTSEKQPNEDGKYTDSLVFMDGPIIEPPFDNDSTNIKERSRALKLAIEKNIIPIGIIKRVYSQFFIERYAGLFTDAAEQNCFKALNHDKNFAIYVLTKFLENSENIGYTQPFKFSDIADMDKYIKPVKQYYAEGIDVLTFLMSNGFSGNPIRVDVAIPADKPFDVDVFTKQIVTYIAQWSAPGRHVPIPVTLAHDQCNIRQGTANILYSDYITGSKTGDVLQDVTAHKMLEETH